MVMAQALGQGPRVKKAAATPPPPPYPMTQMNGFRRGVVIGLRIGACVLFSIHTGGPNRTSGQDGAVARCSSRLQPHCPGIYKEKKRRRKLFSVFFTHYSSPSPSHLHSHCLQRITEPALKVFATSEQQQEGGSAEGYTHSRVLTGHTAMDNDQRTNQVRAGWGGGNGMREPYLSLTCCSDPGAEPIQL